MINCPYCGEAAQLVTGKAIYPHRPDLYQLRFWQCEPCDAYVGCHKPNARMGFDGTQPLGRLANAELRKAKSLAHEAFDPLWQDGYMSRKQAYAWLSYQLAIDTKDCHIGEFDVVRCMLVEQVCDAYFASRCL